MLAVTHIAMGIIALIAGFLALAVQKGGPLHRKSGLVFVISMSWMASSGALLAFLNSEWLNVIAGALTLYLVITAYLSVNVFARFNQGYLLSACIFGLTTGALGWWLSYGFLSSGVSSIDGQPVAVLAVFSSIALAAALSDLRPLINGPLKAKPKLIRHAWRMGIALFLAAASFFLGQAQVIPEAIRTLPVLVGPVLLVLIMTIYWVVRIKFWGLKARR
ncbi:MAG: hypothetical protein ABNH02_06350 [Pseudomonadales bacterium]|jgi:hypothetical protein